MIIDKILRRNYGRAKRLHRITGKSVKECMKIVQKNGGNYTKSLQKIQEVK